MIGESPAQYSELQGSGLQLSEFLRLAGEQTPLDEDLVTFGDLLADRLGEADLATDPEAYKTAVVEVIVDCMTGSDRRTDAPMPERLSYMPPQVASFYRQIAGDWGRQAFGAETGSRIEEIFSLTWPGKRASGVA